MGFEFKSDQPQKKLVDSKTTLSVNNPPLVGEQAVAFVVEETTTSNNDLEWTDYSMGIADPDKQSDNLEQSIFAEGEEEKLAIQFIEENELYVKFMLWCGIQDQLKNLKNSLATTNE